MLEYFRVKSYKCLYIYSPEVCNEAIFRQLQGFAVHIMFHYCAKCTDCLDICSNYQDGDLL